MTTTQTTRTKEIRMPTKTIPTAAEARALADQLEAQERDLTTRRREARKAAEMQAALAVIADNRLGNDFSRANAAWQAAITADELPSLSRLFELWVALRDADAAAVASSSAANARANALAPRFGQGGGQVDYVMRQPVVTADFSQAVDTVLQNRRVARVQQVTNATNERIHEAGTKAEESIQ